MKRTTLAAAIAFALLGAAAPTQADVRIGVQVGPTQSTYYRGLRYSQRVAFDNGYRDGLRSGNVDDARYERFGYRDEIRYREGDAGYRREYGPRFEYVTSYRRGFEEGYRQGYLDHRDRR